MTNGSAPAEERTQGAKMTMRVYTVTPDGTVSEPRALVSVAHGQTPPLEGIGTQLPPCQCARHRQAGASR